VKPVATELTTLAVYEVVPDANIGDRVPLEIVRFESVESVEIGVNEYKVAS
jgi:hypothetical protein